MIATAGRGLLATTLGLANSYLVWSVLQVPTPVRVVATILGAGLAFCLAWSDTIGDRENDAAHPRPPFPTGTLLTTADGAVLVLLDPPGTGANTLAEESS